MTRSMKMAIAILVVLLSGAACSASTGEPQAQCDCSAQKQQIKELQSELGSMRQDLALAEESLESKDDRIAELDAEIESLEAKNEELAQAAEDRGQEEQAATATATATAESGKGIATIKISGTPGLRFEGYLSSLESSRSVEGTIPATFEVEYEKGLFAMDYVDATFNKAFTMKPQRGTLKVEIIVGGEVVNSAQTRSQMGMASATWDATSGN